MPLYFYFNIYSILIEIFFLFCSLVLILFGVIISKNSKYGHILFNKSMQFLCFQILILGLILILNQSAIYLISWNNLLIYNSFSFYAKVIILVLILGWFFSSLDSIKKEKIYNFEYWVLIILMLISLFFIFQVYDLLSAYLTVEFLNLILYVLASFKRSSEYSTESGIKYFILGAFASSLLLFGFSLLYSITGLTNFNDLYIFFVEVDLLSNISIYNTINLSLSFILIALLFKLSVAPFHMWAPDVYEGSPSSITALFAILPKLAIFSLLLKFCLVIFYDLLNLWSYILIFCVICSSFIGTFTAFAQIKWKRFIVYSSISHLSFMLLAIISNDLTSINNLFIYLIIYLIMTLGFFVFFLNFYYFQFPLSYQTRYFSSLNLLILLNPILAASLGIILFSMAGIPPLAGFFAKFFVIFSAIKYKMFNLVFLILLCNCISCFYYIRLVKLLYFNSTLPKIFSVIIPLSKVNTFLLGFCILLLLFISLDFEFLVLLTNLMSFTFI